MKLFAMAVTVRKTSLNQVYHYWLGPRVTARAAVVDCVVVTGSDVVQSGVSATTRSLGGFQRGLEIEKFTQQLAELEPSTRAKAN